MAMTGGTSKLVKSTTTAGFTISLYVYYRSTQNSEKCQSTVYVGMFATTPGSNYNIGPWGDYNGSYVGTTALTFDGSISKFNGTKWLVENKSFTVNHDSTTGKASVTIYWKWGVNSSWGGYTIPSGSFTIDLPTIDRYPTTPTSCTAKVGTDSANYRPGDTITVAWSGATGPVKSYKVQYAIKGPNDTSWGAWTNLTTTTATSVTNSSTRMSGTQIKYRVCALNGTLASSYKESNTLTIRGGVRTRQANTWKKGTVYIKISGEWRRVKDVWININGTWKRSV